jgi:hypothetical protein
METAHGLTMVMVAKLMDQPLLVESAMPVGFSVWMAV